MISFIQHDIKVTPPKKHWNLVKKRMFQRKMRFFYQAVHLPSDVLLLPSFIAGILAQSCSSIGRLRHFFCRLDGSQQTTPERNLRPNMCDMNIWYNTSPCLLFHIVSIYVWQSVSLREKWSYQLQLSGYLLIPSPCKQRTLLVKVQSL